METPGGESWNSNQDRTIVENNNIAFLLQQWVHEIATVLRHTYIAYLVLIILAPLSHHLPPPVNP